MSETANLKLFKHDNPSTNTNPFDVEQALNENWDKIDTAVKDLQDDVEENNTNIDTRLTELETDLGTAKTDITNIKAEQTTQNNNIEANSTAIETNAEAIEQNKEDITDLQAENANLKAQIPKGTAAGEEISLQDSAEMELVDFNLQGNSYQQNEPTLENQSEVQAVGDNINIFDDTVEKVTSIINDSGNEVADTGTNDFYKQIIIPDSKKYIMSYEKNNQGFVRMAYYNGDTFISRQYSNQNGFIFTVPDNCNKIDCRTNAGTNNEIKFTNLKIEKGEVATSYSPYNQGSVEIVKSNKNLLSFEYKTGNGITFDKNRITIIDPTGYLYAGKTLVGGNSFLSGKKVIFTTISNGTISGTLDFTIHTNKTQYRFQKKHTVGTYNDDIKSEAWQFAADEYITSILVYTTGATCNLTIDVQVSIVDAEFIEHQGAEFQITSTNKDEIIKQIIENGTYKNVTHFYTTDETHPNMTIGYYKDLETLFNNIQTQLLNQVGGN